MEMTSEGEIEVEKENELNITPELEGIDEDYEEQGTKPNNKNEIVLKIFNEKNDKNPFIARGIYGFTYSFFEELFKMGHFATFLTTKKYYHIIKHNVTNLIVLMGDTKLQFRFLKESKEAETLYLRALTKRYNNYDNHIAIYISLLLLNKLNKEQNQKFQVHSAFITDSSARVFYEDSQPIIVENKCKVYFGLIGLSTILEQMLFGHFMLIFRGSHII